MDFFFRRDDHDHNSDSSSNHLKTAIKMFEKMRGLFFLSGWNRGPLKFLQGTKAKRTTIILLPGALKVIEKNIRFLQSNTL